MKKAELVELEYDELKTEKEKLLDEMVRVAEKDCPKYKCYWARPNPGMFLQGRGYQSYGDERDKEYICGTRAIHGCPDNPILKKSVRQNNNNRKR